MNLDTKRYVVIRNKKPVHPSELVSFYKTYGRVSKQSKKMPGVIDGFEECVKAGKGMLFHGSDSGELDWHCAAMNRYGGEDIVAMYMHKLADKGGVTYFSDSQSAYNDLDDETKAICKKIKSKVVTYDAMNKLGAMHSNIFYDMKTMMEYRDIDGLQAYKKQLNRKDVVTINPHNKKEGLYFPWTVIRGFTGMPKDDSKDLYYKLKEHTMQEKYIYRHEWQPYDIVLSDQHHSLHKRDSYEGNRELWRSSIWVN